MAEGDVESLLTGPRYVTNKAKLYPRHNNTGSDEIYEPIERTPSQYLSLHTYELAKGDLRHYQQQYVDMYFLRLATLKPVVEQIAQEAWADIEVSSGPNYTDDASL